MMFRIAAILLVLSGLGIADHRSAGEADKYLLSQDAFFAARLVNAQLDIHGKRFQGCTIDRVFVIYAYQTCFVLTQDNGAANGPGFDYIYHGPRPYLSIARLVPDSYYFGESALGVRLKTVDQNMTIVYTSSPLE